MCGGGLLKVVKTSFAMVYWTFRGPIKPTIFCLLFSRCKCCDILAEVLWLPFVLTSMVKFSHSRLQIKNRLYVGCRRMSTKVKKEIYTAKFSKRIFFVYPSFPRSSCSSLSCVCCPVFVTNHGWLSCSAFLSVTVVFVTVHSKPFWSKLYVVLRKFLHNLWKNS